MKKDEDDLGLTYDQALHGVQTAILHEMNLGGVLAQPKHLRVGIDSAHVSHAALCRLLVKKGIFTEEEFAEELRLEANREVKRWEARYGDKIKFR